ncbi:MAG: mechanosensitive ion channel [Anaerolineales bacterium]|nr:mechanosensitive ion channel [Anaerolineales bacterium]
MDFLNYVIFENSIQNWLIALGILVGVYLILILIKRIINNRLINQVKSSETEIDNFIIPVLNQTRWFSFLALGLYLAILALNIPAEIREGLVLGNQVILALQLGFWGTGLISYYVNRSVANKVKEDHGEDATTLDALGLIGKILLWVILSLIILDNLNIEISSLVASLGIGGIAVALALQNILGDLFASISITLDKPFVIGDYVEVDNFAGDVEDIGLKSTRIRSLSGEELIFSNTDLLNSRIRNYKRLEKRRISFSIAVTYGTSVENLKKIPGIVEEIISPLEYVQFERAHFKSLGDYSLNFAVVYHVHNPEYSSYLNAQQTINLELYQRFELEGIEFAYPTQTVIVEQ